MMNTPLLGELAGLATSIFFSLGSIFFTQASRRIGALVLNRTRLVVALCLLGLTHWILFGTPLPLDADPSRWLWLGLSGLVGLALGDIFLFTGYALNGPRLTMLVMSLSPIITSLLAYFFLHETLSSQQLLGILVTIAGIAWVVLQENGNGNRKGERRLAPGLLAGFGAAVCQSGGLVLARQGLGGDFSALSGNVIRMVSAAVFIWLVTLFQGQAASTVKTLRQDPKVMYWVLAGACCGPFIGVSLSLLAIQNAEVGVASTLMALPPVLLLPVGAIFYKERISWQAVAGTLLAMLGIAILFLV